MLSFDVLTPFSTNGKKVNGLVWLRIHFSTNPEHVAINQNQNCSLWTARDEDTFLGVPLPRELCRCCMKAGSLLNSFMYFVFFYNIHQHFLRLRRSLVPTSHQSLCSFSPFPSRNRGWQPKVTGDSSTPSGGKSHHQYSRYLIL